MSMNLISKFQAVLRQGGVSHAVRRTCDYLKYKRALNAHRKQLALQVANLYQWQVAYGPFAGMKISPASWWGQTDLASKILGFYEAEVLEALCRVDQAKRRHFIDLGAADGYYAIGSVISGLFQDAFAFEMSERGQAVIRANAQINGVGEAVHVFGYADASFDRLIPGVNLAQAVMLVDIEGGEFDLLTEALLRKLQETVLIIELHEFMVENGAAKLAALTDRLQKTHSLAWLKTGARNPAAFEALAQLNDTDRWLVCSEGRMQLQQWVVCHPLSAGA